MTWPVLYWFVDAGGLLTLIQLAAIDEGLVSAFVGHPEQKRIFDELLGLSADVVPIGFCLLGRAAPDESSDRSSSRIKERRRPFDALVHRERWRG